mgnify:CR=1 FL=1
MRVPGAARIDGVYPIAAGDDRPTEALVEAGGYAGARSKGTLRLEGRDYPMADGDVITVRFTP